MSTVYCQDVTCVNCHNSSEHYVLGSTGTFGSPDLDLRPSEMHRSTMATWLQLCPHCNYVAPNLSSKVGDLKVVSSSEYRSTINDQRFPELARRFLAHGLLLAASDLAMTAYDHLRAAWVCDDSGQLELARDCRNMAAECFVKLKPVEDTESSIAMRAVFVDVLRRAGQFERATSECVELLALPNVSGVRRKVLEYQTQLIREQDISVHRVDEVVIEPPWQLRSPVLPNAQHSVDEAVAEPPRPQKKPWWKIW